MCLKVATRKGVLEIRGKNTLAVERALPESLSNAAHSLSQRIAGFIAMSVLLKSVRYKTSDEGL